MLDKGMKSYTYTDNVFSFEGCVSVQEKEDCVTPWRIQHKQAEFYPTLFDSTNPNWSAPIAAQCSGVRLCFSTDAKVFVVEMINSVEEMKLDLYVNGAFSMSVVVGKDMNEAAFKTDIEGLKHIEIWLDHKHAFYLKSIRIDESARICKSIENRKRWVHYGSSISHSRAANSPAETWAAIVARKLDLHLTNLGFGANCVMEPMIGLMIRDLPADFITLKLGINVHSGKLTGRTFMPNVIGLIQIIREKHPNTPLVLISPIFSPSRETARVVEDGLSLEEMRECHLKIVQTCVKYGDRNIYYVDGLKIFGPDELKYMPDALHPNNEGQEVMAAHFIKEVFGKFPIERKY